MYFQEFIRQHIASIDKAREYAQNPKDIKFTFLSNTEALREQNIALNKAWFSGNSNELLNIYSAYSWFGFMSNPIYNRNNQNAFWSLSASEANIKRTSCGFIRDIILAMASKVGDPNITTSNIEYFDKVKDLNKYSFRHDMTSQTIIPEALVTGACVLKPCFSKTLSSHPYVEAYDFGKVAIITEGSQTVGYIFKNYYQNEKGDNFVLCESRYRSLSPVFKDGCASIVEYTLLKVLTGGTMGNQQVQQVSLKELPETEGLADNPIITIAGIDYPLAVPVIFYRDNDNYGAGVSIIDSKRDLCDDLDQAYSQQSKTTRVSTPVEYYNSEYMEKDGSGNPVRPVRYDRSYVQLDPPLTDGNGNSVNSPAVTVTQPSLNIDQYNEEIEHLKGDICGQFISPSTMGIGLSKKDNGDSQREKEKITLATRNHLIDELTPALQSLFNMLLMLQEYMDTGIVTIKEHDISVAFNELNSPTTESKINTFIPMLTSKAVSPKTFVDNVWGTTMSEEQKNSEITFITEHMEQVSNNVPNAKDIESRPANDKAEGIESDKQSYVGREDYHPTAENAKKQ